MAVTDLVVEVGFGSTMFDATPVWTDISPFVRNGSLQRGRTSIDGRFGAGTVDLTLDNRDGRFNPENTAGVYSPNVQIGVPVRITESTTSEPIFYGSVRAWPPAYPKSGDSFVTVPLVDAFYHLNLEDLHGNSYPAQSTDERIGAVLDDISWPAGLRSLDIGVASVQSLDFAQPADGGEHPALAHLHDVAESEVGVLFMSRDGNVVFRNRVANSGATASVNLTAAEMSELTLQYNDDYLFNVIRIAREDGVQIEVDASGGNPKRVLTRDVMPMGNDAEALNVAEWLADIFGSQRLRIEGLKLKMYDGAPYFFDVLALELRVFVNVTFTPEEGDVINQDCAVEGIRHEWVPGDWTTYLTVAPLSELETQDYWILGTSELGVSTRLA
jgi:hypothetical protein